jgi:hypothetical protein
LAGPSEDRLAKYAAHVLPKPLPLSVERIIDKHLQIFKELGTMQPGCKLRKMHVHSSISLALKKVEAELEQLEEEGIVELVTFSEWAALLSVMKGDGSIHICGD